jgi:hypothetical protein
VSVAPTVRSAREEPPPAPRAPVERDAEVSPRRAAEFRLLPETPDVSPLRGPATNGGIDGTAFARVMDEARAQIRRQLATEGATPSEVHVTIGRIEVTAAPIAPAPTRKMPERRSAPSLEQYLASRARREP